VEHISAWKSWKNASPPSKHNRLPIQNYSEKFWADYHQQKGHHLPSHLRSSSELLHRLVKDVKLSAHGRHPTIYPFTFVVLVFPIIFLFILVSCITFGFSFQRQKVSSVQVWGCAMSHASLTSSLNFHSRSVLSINSTLGTMFRLSLGVWEHNLTHRVSFLFFFLKKKKNCAYSCCP
jgi:hypothetical protein